MSIIGYISTGLIPEVGAREDLVGLAFRGNGPLQLHPVPIPLRHHLQQLAGLCLGHNVSCKASLFVLGVQCAAHFLSLSQKLCKDSPDVSQAPPSAACWSLPGSQCLLQSITVRPWGTVCSALLIFVTKAVQGQSRCLSGTNFSTLLVSAWVTMSPACTASLFVFVTNGMKRQFRCLSGTTFSTLLVSAWVTISPAQHHSSSLSQQA